MKRKIIFTALSIGLIGVGCRREEMEKAGTPETLNQFSAKEGGLVLNAETQKRIGLETQPLIVTNLPREMKGFGRVLDPAPLAALATEVATAQISATGSQQDLARAKILGENASAKTMQIAEANAGRDQLAVETARMKLRLAWGKKIAAEKNLSEFLRPLVAGEKILVQINLPPGEILRGDPTGARFTSLSGGEPLAGEFLGASPKLDEPTQGQSFLFLATNRNGFAPGAAVDGFVQVAGEPQPGVIVPRDALVRDEGKSWVYLKTAADHFVRREVVLEIPVEGGWFISGMPTNDVVVTGAQTLLSEERKGEAEPP